MIAGLAWRLLRMVPTLLGVVLFSFVLFNVVGGDPSYTVAGPQASAETVARVRAELGFDRPLAEQFLRYLGQVLTLDFGRSWALREDVATIFATRLPATLTVAVPILVLEYALAVPLALWVAARRGTLTDRTVMVVCNVAMSVSFLIWVVVGQWLLAYRLGWFPVQGWSGDLGTNLMRYAPLPVLLALAVSVAPQLRTFRGVVLEELSQDYVRTARAKGATESEVLGRHVLRNALIPVLASLSLSLPGVMTGSFLLEVYFSIPGLGREFVQAVSRSDYPVIQAAVVYVSACLMGVNLAIDAAFRWADPRLRTR